MFTFHRLPLLRLHILLDKVREPTEFARGYYIYLAQMFIESMEQKFIEGFVLFSFYVTLPFT